MDEIKYFSNNNNSLLLLVELVQSWVTEVWKAKECHLSKIGLEPKQKWDKLPKIVQELEDHQDLAEKPNKIVLGVQVLTINSYIANYKN